MHFLRFFTVNYFLVNSVFAYFYFYGDSPLQMYLTQFCSSKDNLVLLLDNPTLSNNATPLTKPQKLSNKMLIIHLTSINCKYLHIQNASFSDSIYSLSQEPQLKYKLPKTQLILDFRHRKGALKHLENIYKILQFLYRKCLSFAPLILLFNEPIHKLEKQTNRFVKELNNNFQLIILSNELPTGSWTVLHLNPVMNGCIQFSGIFAPKNANDFGKLKISFKKCDLAGSVINVSVNEDFPFCRFSQNPNKTLQAEYSIEMQLLNVLESKFQFKANLIDAKGAWGIARYGRWTGVIGQILNRTSQFGLCELSITEDRFDVVDFSHFMIIDQTTFLSQRPGAASNDYILNAMGNYLWALNLISFAVPLLSIGLTLYFYQKFKSTQNSDLSFELVFLELYGIYLKQSILPSSSISSSIRILYNFWALGAFILSNVYSSNIYSQLTVPEYELPIDTPQQLLQVAQDDSYTLLTKDDTSILSGFIHAPPSAEKFYIIGQHMNRTKGKMLDSMDDLIPSVEADPRIITIGTRIGLAARRQLFARRRLHIATEGIETSQLAIPLQRRSPLRKPFNVLLSRMREMGFFEYWLKATVFEVAKTQQTKLRARNIYENGHGAVTQSANKFENINTAMLAFVFLVWSLGLLFSAVVLVIEWALYMGPRWKINKTEQLENSSPASAT